MTFLFFIFILGLTCVCIGMTNIPVKYFPMFMLVSIGSMISAISSFMAGMMWGQ